MRIRLVATDLDGTFFGPDHRPEQRTVSALNAVHAAGVICVAVTGRSHMDGARLATSTGAEFDWFIGSNGGHRLNLRTDEMEERLLFADGLVERLRDDLLRALPDLAFGYESDDRLLWESAFLDLYPTRLGGAPRGLHPTTTTVPDPVGKLFVAHPDFHERDLIEVLEPLVPDDVHLTSSGIDFAEITPASADKGSALARLCTLLDIVADEVIAFGDNLNDLTMLDWAGRGIAMADAPEAVKDIADEVTSTTAEFGVARVLEELV